MQGPRAGTPRKPPLYTPEQRQRRDASRWTLVQGILAPLQLLVFAVSLFLVMRFLATGDGSTAATFSVVTKTLVLYAIMGTGCLWEHDVYGKYLFAAPFFWEDAVSMVVIALHTAYLVAVATDALDLRQQMVLALVAYASYVVNAAQFAFKFLQHRATRGDSRNVALVERVVPE